MRASESLVKYYTTRTYLLVPTLNGPYISHIFVLPCISHIDISSLTLI